MHRHEHRYDLQSIHDDMNAPFVTCMVEGCDLSLTLLDVERRLNATECLSEEMANNIGKAGPRGDNEIPILLAYASILEGNDVPSE